MEVVNRTIRIHSYHHHGFVVAPPSSIKNWKCHQYSLMVLLLLVVAIRSSSYHSWIRRRRRRRRSSMTIVGCVIPSRIPTNERRRNLPLVDALVVAFESLGWKTVPTPLYGTTPRGIATKGSIGSSSSNSTATCDTHDVLPSLLYSWRCRKRVFPDINVCYRYQVVRVVYNGCVHTS